jgi:DENN domain-containing protein 5
MLCESPHLFFPHKSPGFNTHEIRQAFLRFFTSLFQTYRSCLVADTGFRSEDFLAGLNLSERSTLFVKEILGTQMFQNFTEERRESPNDPEVLFFDDSINAKINRSKKVVFTGRKKETSFLDDTRSMVRFLSLIGI